MIKYKYEVFNKYVNDLVNMCDKNLIQQKLQNWQSIPNMNECNGKFGKYFTGVDKSTVFFSGLSKNNVELYLPNDNCTNQVVLGISDHISNYFDYNNKFDSQTFLISTDENWSEEDNNIFVRCGLNGLYSDNCEYSVRVLLPKNKNALFKVLGNKKSFRITVLELLTILNVLDNKTDIKDENKLKNNMFIIEDDSLEYDIILIKNKKHIGGKKRRSIQRKIKRKMKKTHKKRRAMIFQR